MINKKNRSEPTSTMPMDLDERVIKSNKRIIVCADDYGLNPGVSQGIRELVEMERLSAVSCMVNNQNFAQEAEALLLLKSTVQIGLHFNLTASLSSLLLKSHLRILSKKYIQSELETQLNLFEFYFNRQPDFIDGHQHIHQFPIIRDVLLTVYQERFSSSPVYIRCTHPIMKMLGIKDIKSWILSMTGGRALEKRLNQLGIPHNKTFAGVYDFNPETNYRKLFKQWISHAPDGTLIMCHPGTMASNQDAIAISRQNELDYFKSNAYLEDLHKHESKLLFH